jgi:outer membrane protein assembly factor BamA
VLPVVVLLGFSSCSTTKRLADNQYLLVKNEVAITNPRKEIKQADLESLVLQRPNKRFLGVVPMSLWVNSVVKKWGSPPVALDRSLIEESEEQIRQYLSNSGFYNSIIETDVRYKRKKAKKVRYQITLSEPYRIRNFSLQVPDTMIFKKIRENQEKSLIREGRIFNSFVLDAERSRITQILNNSGYFIFTKDYIYFEADSTVGNRQVDLVLAVKQFVEIDPESGDPLPPSNHKVYYINNVWVNPDHRLYANDTLPLDTLQVEVDKKDPDTTDVFHLTYRNPLKIKPNLIARSLFLEPGEKYNATDASQSFTKLNEHRIFKYVDIKFSEAYPEGDTSDGKNYLDANIQMRRNPVHSYSIEAQGTNSGGDLGIGGYLVYQNKNLFRGGEVFYIRLKGALEAQRTSTNPETDNPSRAFFNTYEAGIEANLYIPKFLAPISEELFSKYFRPKTTINIGYNAQNRIEYDRIITNVSFGYEWSVNKQIAHILFPADINIISVNTTPEFQEDLEQESQRFQNQYTDNIIVGLRYSFIYNTQEFNRIKNFMYFRGNFEAAGNLLDLAVNAFGQQENEEGFQTLFGIRYSQFVKADIDYRYYFMWDKKHSVALRGFTGIAIPYGNSIDIPFEKGYFGGGANGLRAWPLRFLGPGSYTLPPDRDRDIERVGDLMFEAQAEYRFPIYRFFTGGLFYDVGNIWLISENETFPGGTFKFGNFFSELAMDVGIGLRLDFNYFIFRVDVAQRLRDPARPKDDRWVIGRYSNWFDPILNLGIGYPF